ncbi:MAG TPA: putative toxin-antitoxin system toxin component, PIN family [Rhodanobacteraceae bacterium]|nr:putative toxin-antitoxin system toxin component, PIN family [Rhodanobacteraceae bacterium]
MSLIAVVDTNVVAAGLMTPSKTAPTAQILDAMLSARLSFALSVALLAEYRDVLNRPSLRQRHALSHEDVESLLVALARDAIILESVPGSVAPDPGDQHLWNLLASHDRLCLVTGDKLLLQHQPAPAPMLTPAGFMLRMAASGVQETRETPV